MNKKIFIAFYIDLENIERDIQLKNMMYNIKLRYDSEFLPIKLPVAMQALLANTGNN